MLARGSLLTTVALATFLTGTYSTFQVVFCPDYFLLQQYLSKEQAKNPCKLSKLENAVELACSQYILCFTDTHLGSRPSPIPATRIAACSWVGVVNAVGVILVLPFCRPLDATFQWRRGAYLGTCRIVFYLLNLHIKSRHTYFARAGTSREEDSYKTDASLSEQGREYAKKMSEALVRHREGERRK